MTKTMLIADLEFQVRRSPRRKTLGVTVDRAGELVVYAPEATSEEELRNWLGRKLLWVHQKLALKNAMTGTAQHPDFVSGESIFYLGKNYRLKLLDDQNEPLRFDGQWFRLRRRDQSKAPQHFRKWYLDSGMQWLSKRIEMWHPKVGTAPSRINIGDLGYRWGSCGKNGVVHFNWRLLQLPVRLVDYVIVHELVHLLEHNHTREFWRILDCVLPDWRDRKTTMESGWQSYLTFGIAEGRSDAI